MKLLRSGEVQRDRRDLVFRHGRMGAVVLMLFLGTALVMMAVLASQASFAWWAWLLASPVIVIAGLVMLLALHACAQVVWRSFGPANWIARIRRGSLDLNLRSYQNAHFPDDAPTVVHLEFAEILCVRRVRERWEDHSGRRRVIRTLRWLEFELRGVDTTELAAAARFERDRPAPETRFLGVRGRSRFQHVTVLVTDDGRVRVLDAGAKLRRELQRHVKFAGTSETDLDQAHEGDLDARLRALIARGETMSATKLVRIEMGVSQTEAKQFVEELRRAA